LNQDIVNWFWWTVHVCLDIIVNWFWLTVHVFLDFDSSHWCVALTTIRIPWSTFGPWSFAMPASNLTCLFYFVSERIWENEFRAPNQQFKQGNSTSLCAYSQMPYIDDDQCFFFYILLGRNEIIRAKQKDIVTFLVIFTFVFSVWVLELPIFLQSISACKLPCHGEHEHCFLFLIEFLYSIQAHVLLFFLFKYLFFKILWIECFWFSKLNLFMLRNLSSAIC